MAGSWRPVDARYVQNGNAGTTGQILVPLVEPVETLPHTTNVLDSITSSRTYSEKLSFEKVRPADHTKTLHEFRTA
jgi:hypothetical protein